MTQQASKSEFTAQTMEDIDPTHLSSLALSLAEGDGLHERALRYELARVNNSSILYQEIPERCTIIKKIMSKNLPIKDLPTWIDETVNRSLILRAVTGELAMSLSVLKRVAEVEGDTGFYKAVMVVHMVALYTYDRLVESCADETVDDKRAHVAARGLYDVVYDAHDLLVSMVRQDPQGKSIVLGEMLRPPHYGYASLQVLECLVHEQLVTRDEIKGLPAEGRLIRDELEAIFNDLTPELDGSANNSNEMDLESQIECAEKEFSMVHLDNALNALEYFIDGDAEDYLLDMTIPLSSRNDEETMIFFVKVELLAKAGFCSMAYDCYMCSESPPIDSLVMLRWVQTLSRLLIVRMRKKKEAEKIRWDYFTQTRSILSFRGYMAPYYTKPYWNSFFDRQEHDDAYVRLTEHLLTYAQTKELGDLLLLLGSSHYGFWERVVCSRRHELSSVNGFPFSKFIDEEDTWQENAPLGYLIVCRAQLKCFASQEKGAMSFAEFEGNYGDKLQQAKEAFDYFDDYHYERDGMSVSSLGLLSHQQFISNLGKNFMAVKPYRPRLSGFQRTRGRGRSQSRPSL